MNAIMDNSAASAHFRTLELCSHGVSLQGARQFVDGEIVTGLADRQRLAQLTLQGGRTENVGHNESITIHGGRTENVTKNETITISANRKEALQEIGISAVGAWQFLTGQPVGNSQDRKLISTHYGDLVGRGIDITFDRDMNPPS